MLHAREKRGEVIGYPGRRWCVFALIVVVAAGLLWRGVELQLRDRRFLENQGESRYTRVVTLPAHRGKITDRNGEALAISTPVESVWGDPSTLVQERQQWPALERVLGLDRATLQRLVAGHAQREFVWLRRHVDPELAARVKSLNIPGVALQSEYRRYYPTGEVFAHVLGFTNIDDQGQEGLELAYNHWLEGVDGSERVLRDRLGHIVEDVDRIRSPRPGHDLVLSLDGRIQYIAYRALKAAVQRTHAHAGEAVVLDPHTGEVLAMVNQPSYNPNRRAERISARYRNRAVTDVFEPGSTIKPFTIAAALESGRYTPESPIDTTPGYYRLDGYTIRDARDYGLINVATVIQKSSNVGASRIALSIDPKLIWHTLTAAGFGQTTGSGFPGEASGVLTYYSHWRKIQRATLAFGYGLSVTALQLAHAYTAIANDGRMPQVTFRRVSGPVRTTRVMPARIARELRKMLEAVVTPEGTAERAAIPGYQVAGKTGTVRKAKGGGYERDHYIAVFAGMAPASDPRLVTVVTVDDPRDGPYYGGLVAAPVFAQIMAGALRILGVPPGDSDGPEQHMAMAGGGPGAGAGGDGPAAVEAMP